MAQRLSGEPNNLKFDSLRPEKEVTTTTIGTKTGIDTRSYVSFVDGYNLDGFGRQRVSEPHTLFDSKQIFDNQPLFFDDQEVSGTGTTSVYNKNRASSLLTVSSNTAGKRVRQTFMRFNYQSGKSQLINATGILCNNVESSIGIVRSFGYFDDKNGIFLRDNEGVKELVIRSFATGTAVDNAIAQTDWNVDKFDGTGPSGVTLDFTKTQILFIDLEWLGVGRVRVGFVVDGKIFYAHYFNNANNLDVVYMSTPNLPIRYEIENLGNGAACGIEHICCSVMSEGGIQSNGVLRHYNSPRLTGLQAGVKYIFMAGRLKTDSIGATIDIENISIISTAPNDNAKWELYAGGTYAGTLTFNDFTHSRVQIANGNKTQTYTNSGIVIDGGYFTTSLPTTSQVKNALKLGSSIDGTPQEFYFVVTPITNNITVEASITWRELS